jgi:hypothetical protein
MTLIKKSTLFYTDYSWTVIQNDSPKITGEPDNTLLNRMEGSEILYFINNFCDKFGLKREASALKIELMIRNEVPIHLKSQIKIKEWIKENWTKSKY